MKIFAMMFGDVIKYVGMDKKSVQKCVDHQNMVYSNPRNKRPNPPKVWLAEMEPIPTPVAVSQPRDKKGRFCKE
jgi:hypothetical protein